jgi:RNA polymerase sigma-70 factor (ECF subfamily)
MVPSRDDGLSGLLTSAAHGNTESLGILYTRYADLVYACALRCLASQPDAEDVLQDVFVGLPEALHNYGERGTFESWLRRVAIRTALMKLRSRERRRERAIDFSDLPPVAPHPDADIIDRVAARRAILQLPDTLRPVFILKEVEGYSHREIAELLGISPGASAVRLNRAWELLLQSTRKADDRRH